MKSCVGDGDTLSSFFKAGLAGGYTTIRTTRNVRDILEKIKIGEETFNDVIVKLLNNVTFHKNADVENLPDILKKDVPLEK